MPAVIYGPPSLGLYCGTGKLRMSMASPSMISSWHGAPFAGKRRRDRVVEAVQHLVEDRGLVGLEGEQRLFSRRIDAGDQRIIGAVVVEHDGRAVADVSLLHRLADVVQGDRPIDVDQLAMLAQHIEELAEVLEGHFLSFSNWRRARTRFPGAAQHVA